MAPGQMTLAEPWVIEHPLASQFAIGCIQTNQRGIHPVQVVFLVGKGPWNAAVGHHQITGGIKQQLVRLLAVARPFGNFLQAAPFSHTDLALPGFDIRFGGVDHIVVQAVHNVSVQAGTAFLLRQINLAKDITLAVTTQHPLPWPNTCHQQAATRFGQKAVRTSRQGDGVTDFQLLFCPVGGQHASVISIANMGAAPGRTD